MNVKEIELAELLHKKLCHHNLMDYCDYEYYKWDDISSSKKQYLNKAQRILREVSFEEAIKILNLL